MVGSVLGFGASIKKSAVENYFKRIQGTVTDIKTKLGQIV
ncbi:Variable outer membrane protein (plasmid) [Borrelia hermsii MTW]|nr:Variable outer membrane protein [Borrelia hermsii MTW]